MLISVIGADRKSGATTVAKSIAQSLSKRRSEQVLFISDNGRDCILSPRETEETLLGEMGYSYMEGFSWDNAVEMAKEQFGCTVSDLGSLPLNDRKRSVAEESDCALFVFSQTEADTAIAEKAIPTLRNLVPVLYVLNRFLPEDPHDANYIKKRMGIDELYLLRESEKGREAQWEEKTPVEFKDRAFTRDIRKISERLEELQLTGFKK